MKDEEESRTINDFYLVELVNYTPTHGKGWAEFEDIEIFLKRADTSVLMFVYDGYLIQEYTEGVISCRIQ